MLIAKEKMMNEVVTFSCMFLIVLWLKALVDLERIIRLFAFDNTGVALRLYYHFGYISVQLKGALDQFLHCQGSFIHTKRRIILTNGKF